MSYKVKFSDLQPIALPREFYSGDYSITPTESAQVLPVNQKAMSSDLTVNPIPSSYFDTSGDTGVAADVADGAIVHGANGEIVGTMPVNLPEHILIANKEQCYTVPAGKHFGHGDVSIAGAERNKIIPSNIKGGVTILGVPGASSVVDVSGDNVVASALRGGYTAHGADGSLVEGNLRLYLQNKTATANGSYSADIGYDGIGIFIVDVPEYNDHNDFIGFIEGGVSTIKIPDGATKLKPMAFANDSDIMEVELPESLKNIGSNAFYACSNLESISFPDRLTHIGSSAFHTCGDLVFDEIPESVTNIGALAFAHNTSLTSIEILGNPTIDGDSGTGVFYGCTNLESVTIGAPGKPMDSSKIHYGAFRNCNNLTSITIYTEGATPLIGAPFGAINATVIYVAS